LGASLIPAAQNSIKPLIDTRNDKYIFIIPEPQFFVIILVQVGFIYIKPEKGCYKLIPDTSYGMAFSFIGIVFYYQAGIIEHII